MNERADICFRADASVQIGTGHVMRCLALAGKLAKSGRRSVFVCRSLPQSLAERIRAEGHRLCFLTSIDPDATGDGAVDHAAWLGVGWKTDAAECREVFLHISPKWIVVDHYALDARWERLARPETARLMVIDDLADRQHNCDILLDQNLGRSDEDYLGLLPADAICLTGPAYALLRPEFADVRPISISRRQRSRLEHVMISMGGMDAENATGQILYVLERLAARTVLSGKVRLSIVMGQNSPHLETVQAKAAILPFPADVLVEVQDMASLMVETDLAIGAAGSTSWERCCLGVPALVLVLAENQKPAAIALSKSGASGFIGDLSKASINVSVVESALRRLLVPENLRKMSIAAATVCDGRGAERCADLMEALTLRTDR